jgi:hypothetical protein
MALRTSRRAARACLVLLFVTGLPTLSISQQITYECDALGRLTVGPAQAEVAFRGGLGFQAMHGDVPTADCPAPAAVPAGAGA